MVRSDGRILEKFELQKENKAVDIAVDIRNGMEKMQQAFEIHAYCAMSLNYLANHFFFTDQHFLVEELTETALAAVTMHGPTKAHSYYNLARSYHSKGDYEKAGMYYMASVQESNSAHEFVLPYYGLGQVQLKLGDLRSVLTIFEKALGHIHVSLSRPIRPKNYTRKPQKLIPVIPQAFMDLGDLLISTDINAALDTFKTYAQYVDVFQSSLDLEDALKVDEKCPDACGLGSLE